MRIWSALLLVSWLPGQDVEPRQKPAPQPRRLNLRKAPLTPQEMLKAMVAQDQARRAQPGATVEVIGYDDEAMLRRLSLTLAERVRLEFHATDKLGHKELYSFLHQNPNRPAAASVVPMLAGGTATRAGDPWLR